MKRSIILVIFSLFLMMESEAQIKVEVSESVELMSILSRTAGLREYNMDMAGQYTRDTETWFAPFKDHPIIVYYQGLHDQQSISYDAVMSMAVHLDIDKGKVKFLGDPSDLEKRWNGVDVEDFITRLNQFYTDTRFHEFYKKHRAFYEEGVKAYETNVMSYFHQDWYARFYGMEPVERFRVIIGFTNGGGNYGPSRQLAGQPKEVFAICGYYLDPTTGQAFANGANQASTLIHEFNHSFVNPLLDNVTNTALIETTGKRLQKLSKLGMERQHYLNWQTVVNESIVRAAVILYMLDQGFSSKQVSNEMAVQVCSDFHWMPELVGALRRYVSHRDQYPTLNDFYPEIASCLGQYVESEFERMREALK